MGKDKKSDEEWARLIDEMRLSGVRQREWCAEHGVSYHTMRSWYARLYGTGVAKSVTEPTPSNWVEVSTVREALTPNPCTQSICVQVGAFSLYVGRDFDEDTFLKACKALQELC